jgi:hypothetical protein
MINDKEAKKKWCPMVRDYSESGPSCNSSSNISKGRNPEWSRCIGSECMMWRLFLANEDDNASLEGYCGLAGKPAGSS